MYCVDMAVMFIVSCVAFTFWLITQLPSTNTDSLERSRSMFAVVY